MFEENSGRLPGAAAGNAPQPDRPATGEELRWDVCNASGGRPLIACALLS